MDVAIIILLLIIVWLSFTPTRDKPENKFGIGNGDDETDYEESNPDRK
jgi:hypothetical protein